MPANAERVQVASPSPPVQMLPVHPHTEVGVPAVVRQVLSGSGSALDAETRSTMEGRFGHDFGQVRVHTDAEAGRSAQELHAQAYTLGRHIVLGPGQYQPRSPEGQRLLAHELTHVVQQGNPTSDGPVPDEVSHPDDPAEREASAEEAAT